MVLVRGHVAGGAVSLIEQALSNSTGVMHEQNFVAIGDDISVDEQVSVLPLHACQGSHANSPCPCTKNIRVRYLYLWPHSQDGFLKGHGTQVVEGRLVATLCGVVERVNKLVWVRPLRSRCEGSRFLSAIAREYREAASLPIPKGWWVLVATSRTGSVNGETAAEPD